MGSIFRMWCLALILLLLCSHSWGACTTTAPYTIGCSYLEAWGAPRGCNYEQWGKCPVACAKVTAGVSGTSVLVGPIVGQNSDPCRCDASAMITCSTQAEADSVYCAQNPTAEGCGNCKAADSTWLSNVVDSCNAVHGENNYSIIDTNDVCEHRGHCCPMDSTITGNACTWKCESVASQCQPPLNFYSGILLDTTVSDTGDVVQGRCYYNCINYVPSDTTKAMVSGNILLTGPVSVMSQGTKVPNAFNSVRITDSDTYIYDYLFPQAEHYVDSIVFTPCVKSLYRGILNGKYVYWYDGQTAPAGVTNIVKVK